MHAVPEQELLLPLQQQQQQQQQHSHSYEDHERNDASVPLASTTAKTTNVQVAMGAGATESAFNVEQHRCNNTTVVRRRRRRYKVCAAVLSALTMLIVLAFGATAYTLMFMFQHTKGSKLLVLCC